MNISNKHYRDTQKAIDALNRQKTIDDALTKIELGKLENQRDGSVRTMADYVGKLIGHLLFNSK